MTNINENFNVCEIGDITKKILGLSSNSSSPTDTWIVYFKDGITYNDEPLNSGFLKIFIDNIVDENLALKYELNVYKIIISDFIKYKICPNFVNYLASGIRCSYENLLKILKNNLYNPDLEDIEELEDSEKIIDIDECNRRLNRNLYFILKNKNNRPAIQSDYVLPLLRPVNLHEDHTIKYNIILTENMKDTITFNKWLIQHSKDVFYDTEFWNIIFQICVACYVMSLSKMVHNDLHSSNIFIKDLGVEKYFLYDINNSKTIIKTRYQALIYDFDRAYVERFGPNAYLQRSLCEKYSQCNKLYDNKDILKIFCYVYKIVNKTIKNQILELLTSNLDNKISIKTSYDHVTRINGIKSCFLQYEDSRGHDHSLPDEIYSIQVNSSIEIINRVKLHLNTYSEELVSDKMNIYTCNTTFFNLDGSLNIENIMSHKDNDDEKVIDIWKKYSKDEKGEKGEEDYLNLELSDYQLKTISDLLKSEEKKGDSLSAHSSHRSSGHEFLKNIESLLLKTRGFIKGEVDYGENYTKIDDFVVQFSSDIVELKKFEYGKEKPYSNKHYNIFNLLLESLSRRKKYAHDFNLWEELYYHSIFFYPNIKKIGNIPTVLVTKHNHILPFYMKHNIGELNTTFLHFDTHPDMNTVKNSIDLPHFNQTYLETKNKNYLDSAQKIVWDIGAAISGVILTTGIQNYIWGMPEWIPDPNIKTKFFIKENKKAIGLYSNDPKVEDNDLIDLTYINRFKNTDKPERNYIKIQTGKDDNLELSKTLAKELGSTYILDIDLDYFVCNGQKLNKKSYLNEQYDVSSSYRTEKIIFNEDNPRNFYYNSEDAIKFNNTLKKELSIINKRIKKFLSLIKKLKNKGCIPSHISICDSTNIEFNLCKKCNSLSNGYVPTNLALIVHDKVFYGLKELFE